MYPRLFSVTSLPLSQSFFFFGPRSTGKTTLIGNYLEQFPEMQKMIYNFLKSDDFLRLHTQPSLLRKEIEAHLKKLKSHILQVHLDEVQKIPLLLDEVHYLIEKYPNKIRFILSGSSARKLKKGGANLLGGRAWEKHLHPLSLLEIGNDFQLNDVVQYGSLPPIISQDLQFKSERLKAYVNTYLREEIQEEALTRRLDSFHRFLEVAAYNQGELINTSNIAQEASVPRKTVNSYYQILEDTLVGFFLPSWGQQLSRKDLISHGKFYFFDNGVVSALTKNLSTPIAPKSSLFGKLFESYCINEFRRIHDYKGTEHKLGFFRTRSGLEIDLVQEKHGKIRAIEIKASQTISKNQIRHLTKFEEEFKEAELIVLAPLPRPFDLGKIQCLPFDEFFKQEWETS